MKKSHIMGLHPHHFNVTRGADFSGANVMLSC